VLGKISENYIQILVEDRITNTLLDTYSMVYELLSFLNFGLLRPPSVSNIYALFDLRTSNNPELKTF